MRITSRVTAFGKIFEIEDNWKRSGREHRVLKESRTGSTKCSVKAYARNKLKADLIAAPKDPASQMESSRRVSFAAMAAGERGR